MSMPISDARRIIPGLPVIMLAGCGSAPNLPEGDPIACQPAGATSFAQVCTVERDNTKDGLILIVRNPDGGFRRLAVAKDGRGVIAADGAEPAKISVLGSNEIEVALGGDHYRLPATLKGSAAKPAQ